METRIAPLRPVIAAHEQVPAIKPFNLDMKVLLTTEETAGATSVIIAWHKPGEGPPDHVHFDQEEIFFIVDGRYELTVDGQTSMVDPGTLVFLPRNTVHRFRNAGETPACMLDWTLPGGQDRYFKEISELAADGSFSSEKVAELNKEHHTTFAP
jgi:mannose-6-phosphate isomerase-like protein (cupin superfamily)